MSLLDCDTALEADLVFMILLWWSSLMNSFRSTKKRCVRTAGMYNEGQRCAKASLMQNWTLWCRLDFIDEYESDAARSDA